MTDQKIILPHEVFPGGDQEADHKTVIQAISDTSRMVGKTLQQTKNRRKWLYIASEASEDEVKTFFNKDLSTASRVGVDDRGRRMVAVWNGTTVEPEFDPDFNEND